MVEAGRHDGGDRLPRRRRIVALQDRRKNIVQLTEAGEHCLSGAGRARDEVERDFLAPLGDDLGRQFLRALQILAGV